MLIEDELNEQISTTEITKADEELDKAIDTSIAVLPLNAEENKIINNIINAPTQKELQEQFDLFNVNQSKKNALRIIKLNGLLDRVEDQAIERFESRPDQISNKELLDYMQVVSNQIDRAQKFIDTLKDKPMISVNNQKNEVNINIGTELTRDSKERVMDAISVLLKQLDKGNTAEVIDADTVETETENPSLDDITEETIDSIDVDNLLNTDEGEN